MALALWSLNLGGRRAKWDAFWQRPQVEAETTHRLSAALALSLLHSALDVDRPHVLDLGCGSGRVAELLAARCEVIGLDLARAALSAARRRLGPTAPLILADAFHLPFADGSFDAVISLGYASVGSYPGVQAELARVLRPGGLALIDFRRFGLYHLALLPLRAGQFARAWRRGEVSVPILGFRPNPAWAEAGFRLDSVSLFNTYPPLGTRLPAALALRFEARIGCRLAPLLARTALARFRKE